MLYSWREKQLFPEMTLAVPNHAANNVTVSLEGDCTAIAPQVLRMHRNNHTAFRFTHPYAPSINWVYLINYKEESDVLMKDIPSVSPPHLLPILKKGQKNSGHFVSITLTSLAARTIVVN